MVTKLSGKADSDKNVLWDVFNSEVQPNQLWNVDKEFSPEELAIKVQELQESTASDIALTAPLFVNPPNKKLNRFPYSVNGENRHPAVLKKFNGLKSNTKGWSGVNKFFLDSLPLAMLELVLLVINPVADCLDAGIYPEILRYSRVVILPKKGKGIRPLAISECLNSVLEKVIMSTLNSFIEGIKGLPDQQSGFRCSRSCGTALFEIIKTYEESRARDEVLAVIFLDARNAFGSPSRKSLMVVLRQYF